MKHITAEWHNTFDHLGQKIMTEMHEVSEWLHARTKIGRSQSRLAEEAVSNSLPVYKNIFAQFDVYNQ